MKRDGAGFESSLTRETDLNGKAPDFVPENGEFESFPEIPAKSADNLRSKGYKNLFPI